MRKEGLSNVNNEILAIFSQSDENLEDYQTNKELDQKKETLLLDNTFQNELLDEINLKFFITQFILFHRLPFSISADLLEFIQNLVSNFKKALLIKCTLNRSAVTEITQHCISASLKEQIFHELTLSPFSLLIDGGSDNYGKSYLTICAKFIVRRNRRDPVTKLLSVIELGTESTGEALFNLIQDSIFRDEAIKTNFVALATDQGSNMIGTELGLGARLKEVYPSILTFHDLSHIFHLICKYSLEEFPNHILEIVKEVSSHFKRSNQRKALFQKFLVRKGLNPELTILNYTPNRWLSLTQCLERILKLWGPLEEYFQEHGEESEKKYFNMQNKLYANNLFILLEQITHYNKLFQATQMRYNEVFYKLNESFNVFAQEILIESLRGKSVIETIELPWENQVSIQRYLVNCDVFMAQWLKQYPDTKVLTERLSHDGIKEVFEASKRFLIRALKEMKTRLPYKSEILERSLVAFFRYRNL